MLARGRAIYHGLAANAGQARLFEIAAPLSRFACARCHGEDAEGGREGVTPAPALRLDRLVAKTPTYADPAALAKTLETGVSPDARVLSTAMPRFNFEMEDAIALHRWLGDVAADQRRGFGPDAIRIRIKGSSDFVKSLRAELDRAVPNGIWGLPLLATAASDEESATAHAHSLRPANENSQTAEECFAALGGPVAGCAVTLFPSAGLVGDEPPTMRGLWASRADQVRALMQAAQSGVVLVGDRQDETRIIAVLGAGFTQSHPSEQRRWRIASRLERRPIQADHILLLCDPAEVPQLLASVAYHPNMHLFALRSTLAPWLPALLRQGVSLTIAGPTPFKATEEESSELFVRTSVAVLVAVLRKCGANCTRARFIAIFDELKIEPVGWVLLDYKDHRLTGTREVTLTRLPQHSVRP